MYKKILVVLGGNSRERTISIKTGKACIAAIKRLGFKVEKFDPKIRSLSEIKKTKSKIIFNVFTERRAKMVMLRVFSNFQKSPIPILEYCFNEGNE